MKFCIALGTLTMLAVTSILIALHYQSQAFNKLTGANTTWQDAFWLELRVVGVPKDTSINTGFRPGIYPNIITNLESYPVLSDNKQP